MRTGELMRLSDLLARFHEERAGEGELRDAISYVRSEVNDEIDAREDG